MEFSCILKGKYTVFTGGLDITCERMDLPFSEIRRNNFGGQIRSLVLTMSR